MILEMCDIPVESFENVLSLLNYHAGVHFYKLFVIDSYQFAEHGFHKKVSEGLTEKLLTHTTADLNDKFRAKYPKNVDFGREPVGSSEVRSRKFKTWHSVKQHHEQGEYDTDGRRDGRVIIVCENGNAFVNRYNKGKLHGKQV